MVVALAQEKIEILTSADKVRWGKYFQKLPVAIRDINFSFDYNFLYECNGDGELRLFVYSRGEDVYFYPFLIRNIDSDIKGFKDIETVYGYTGPISTTTDENFIQQADHALRNYCKDEKIVTEFIRFNPLLHNEELHRNNSSLSLIPLRNYVTVDLTPSCDDIHSSYSSANRNKIRKAEKAGIIIREDCTAESFNSFVKIYVDNMKQLNASKMYFFSDIFFEKLRNLILSHGVLVRAVLDEETIGASVFLKGESFAHYFLSSSSEKGKQTAASNLMLHHGILWCKNKGMKKLHLGGGITEKEDDPLLVFKTNFSSNIEKFYIGKRIHDKENYERIVSSWEKQFPEHAIKYKSILQRYRLRNED